MHHISSNYTPKYLPKGNISRCPQEDLYKNVQSGLVQSSHNWKQPKCSLTGDNEQSVVCPYARIYTAAQRINYRYRQHA